MIPLIQFIVSERVCGEVGLPHGSCRAELMGNGQMVNLARAVPEIIIVHSLCQALGFSGRTMVDFARPFAKLGSRIGRADLFLLNPFYVPFSHPTMKIILYSFYQCWYISFSHSFLKKLYFLYPSLSEAFLFATEFKKMEFY